MAIKSLKQKLLNSISKISLGNSLKARSARGGVWLGSASIVEQGLRFIRNIILTRILVPEAFGIMAIVMAVNELLWSVTEIGVKEAIVQSPYGEERFYLNGAWHVSIIHAVITYGIAYFSAPWISDFYGNFEITLLIRVAFLAILFRGLISPRAYVSLKQMDFKRWVLIYQGGAVCGILVTIFLSIIIRNVWALVIGFSFEYAADCILSYLICPFFPKFEFKREFLKSLLKYAGGMIGLPILVFIYMRTDIFVVGKILPIAILGLYSMAINLARMPLHLLIRILNELMMPAFSQIQSDNKRINYAILTITKVIVFIGFPIIIFCFIYGKEILTVIYGKQYAVAALPFAIVFTSELLRISSAPMSTYYLMSGRPKLQRLFTGIRAFFMVALIYPGVKYFGLMGAATTGLISLVIAYCFQIKQLHDITSLDITRYISIFLIASGFSLCIVIFWFITYDLFQSQVFLKILPGIIGCLFTYTLALIYFLKSGIVKELFISSKLK